jgi:hypothetical protein
MQVELWHFGCEPEFESPGDASLTRVVAFCSIEAFEKAPAAALLASG